MLPDPYVRIPFNSATTLLRAQSEGSHKCSCHDRGGSGKGQERTPRRVRRCSVGGGVMVPVGFQMPLAGPRCTWRASTPNVVSSPSVRVDPPVVVVRSAAFTRANNSEVRVSPGMQCCFHEHHLSSIHVSPDLPSSTGLRVCIAVFLASPLVTVTVASGPFPRCVVLRRRPG